MLLSLQTEDLVRNYNREVKMREESYVPKSVEEHLQISSRTGACHLLACASLVGMDVTATKESFDWVSTMPKMVLALCTILRLVDDLKTYEVINIYLSSPSLGYSIKNDIFSDVVISSAN